MYRTQAFKVSGSANSRVWDTGAGYSGKTGLQASAAEPKKLIGLQVNLTKHTGNVVLVAKGQTELVQLYDYSLDTSEISAGNSYKVTGGKMAFIPLEIDLAPGEVIQAGLNCGATTSDLYGAYVYDDGAK